MNVIFVSLWEDLKIKTPMGKGGGVSKTIRHNI
jgi:hypothetical protein